LFITMSYALCASSLFIFFFKLSGHHPALHSFPTRRSSDLTPHLPTPGLSISARPCQCRACASNTPSRHRRPIRVTRCAWRCRARSEEHTSELQSRENLVCRLLLEKKKKINQLSIGSSNPSP